MADQQTRNDWVDIAKALCIIAIVMMHSTLGYQKAVGATGFLDPVVAFLAPIRVPALFVLSGLYLGPALARGWSAFLRRRIAHLAYFYMLWALIQLMLKEGGLLMVDPAAFAGRALLLIVEPYGTLWFIHLLAIFSVVAFAARRVAQELILACAFLLNSLSIETGSTLADEFAARFIFFAAGWIFADRFFRAADWSRGHVAGSLVAASAFAILNLTAVSLDLATVPLIGPALGLAGMLALIAISVRLSAGSIVGRWLTALGQQTLPIYLAFFLPMSLMRLALLKLDLVETNYLSRGVASVAITLVALTAPLVLARLVRGTAFGFLFQKPWIDRLAARQLSKSPELDGHPISR